MKLQMPDFIKITLVILFALYAVIILISCNLQSKLIFHPEMLDKNFVFDNTNNGTEVNLNTSDGATINALFYKTNSEKVILYFHGNAGSLRGWQNVYNDFKKFGYNFFIIDYRTYGKSIGKISEKGLYLDAQTAYNYLISKGFLSKNIIIYGRSIGTGIATEIAGSNEIHSLILEAPFMSLKKLAAEIVPYLLPSLYLNYSFDNLKKINNVHAPVLIIHGDNDSAIPVHHGKKLYDEFKNTKYLVIIKNGEHNNLSAFPEFHKALADFFAEKKN